MKNNKLRKLVWAFFALTLTATGVFAQGWRYTNGTNQNNCLNSITGLSEKQKSKILEMEEKHQNTMAEMRVNQRSTNDFTKKGVIREEMTKMVADHRGAVKNLLNKEQQKQYDALHLNNSFDNQQNFANRKSNRNFKGQSQSAGNRKFNQRNDNGRMYAQNNAGCGGNGNRFANGQNNTARRNARFNQCTNFQRGNGRFYQQNKMQNRKIQNTMNKTATTDENN